MQLWTLAYHNRNGTGAHIFTNEMAAYQALVNMTVDPTDLQAMLTARKMLLLRQFDDLCRWLQHDHFGTVDDYRIQTHHLNIAREEPE
jgi:hypothetical protein